MIWILRNWHMNLARCRFSFCFSNVSVEARMIESLKNQTSKCSKLSSTTLRFYVAFWTFSFLEFSMDDNWISCNASSERDTSDAEEEEKGLKDSNISKVLFTLRKYFQSLNDNRYFRDVFCQVIREIILAYWVTQRHRHYMLQLERADPWP
jgi:hypothetical protein